jgi:DNA polymerase
VPPPRESPQDAASGLIPEHPTLQSLREAAAGCKACDLWKRGTQTVFGEGGEAAGILLVGEQPGHEEDLSGRPFVGPAGRLLDRALRAAGIDRSLVYVTNVVKHFKWEREPRGKRRIHKKPCLGATAAQALLGNDFRVTRHRGEIIRSSALAPCIVATVHPSAILRAPDDETRRNEMARFVEDLRLVAAIG